MLKIDNVNLGGKSVPERTEIEMLMEMPFVKTLVAAPFRCTQSEKTELCKSFQCESESDFWSSGGRVGVDTKPEEESKSTGP